MPLFSTQVSEFNYNVVSSSLYHCGATYQCSGRPLSLNKYILCISLCAYERANYGSLHYPLRCTSRCCHGGATCRRHYSASSKLPGGGRGTVHIPKSVMGQWDRVPSCSLLNHVVVFNNLQRLIRFTLFRMLFSLDQNFYNCEYYIPQTDLSQMCPFIFRNILLTCF